MKIKKKTLELLKEKCKELEMNYNVFIITAIFSKNKTISKHTLEVIENTRRKLGINEEKDINSTIIKICMKF